MLSLSIQTNVSYRIGTCGGIGLSPGTVVVVVIVVVVAIVVVGRCCCCCCQYKQQICLTGLGHVVELVCHLELSLSPRRPSMEDFVHSLIRHAFIVTITHKMTNDTNESRLCYSFSIFCCPRSSLGKWCPALRSLTLVWLENLWLQGSWCG